MANDPDYIVKKLCTADEACKLIRKYAKGRWVFVRTNTHLYTNEEQTRYFESGGSVRVSLRVALSHVNTTMLHFEERGAKIDVRVLRNCIFIG